LQRDEEAADLAAIEKARKDAEDARRATLRDEIENNGKVYFKIDSSDLTTTDKGLLDKLAMIMKDETGTSIIISAHTYSRGPDKYNQWLSERRAERTVEYIVSK